MAEGFTYGEATIILESRINEDTYVGLSSTTPDKTGANFTEPSAAAGYTRTKFGPLNKQNPAQIANKNIIFIFEALEDCGSVTHVGLFKNDSTPFPFLVARLTSALTIGAGYVPLIRANRFVIGLDKEVLEPYV